MSTPNTQPCPFTLSIPDSDLALLREKLEATRFPDELDDAGWHYGAPLADVTRLVARWRDGYDWRAAEAGINAIPQFTVDVQVEGFGVLNVHFVHQRSEVENAIPLLFVHGWPGHFMEVAKLLPLLTSAAPDYPSFHVVAPSLPNFGFSEGVRKQGFAVPQHAETCHKLMLALGYTEYVVQGGDWGTYISRTIAGRYGPQHAKAWHTNYAAVIEPPSLWKFPRLWLQHMLTPYSEQEKEHLQRTRAWLKNGRGYSAEQGTQPQTLGCALADSPAGLLAWLYEKLMVWSDDYPWDDDEILTWVSIYWFSRAGPAASVRIYFEEARKGDHPNACVPWCATPGGVSLFPKEHVYPPKVWIRTMGNIVFEAEHDSGGHFAAHEQPQHLVGDLRKMFGRGGPAFGAVTGKQGYH